MAKSANAAWPSLRSTSLGLALRVHRTLAPRGRTEMRALSFGRGTVFLFDLFTFTREGPVTVERLRLFADGFGHSVDLEVFEHMHAKLAGACKVDVAVVVEVCGDDLSTGAGGSVDGKSNAGEDGVCRAVCDEHISRGLLRRRGGVGPHMLRAAGAGLRGLE